MSHATIRRVTKCDASRIRAEAVSAALDIIADAQGLERGSLVAVTCDRCANACWRCGVGVDPLNPDQHDRYGRGVCGECWNVVDHE
jgi:hypothetical protein